MIPQDKHVLICGIIPRSGIDKILKLRHQTILIGLCHYYVSVRFYILIVFCFLNSVSAKDPALVFVKAYIT